MSNREGRLHIWADRFVEINEPADYAAIEALEDETGSVVDLNDPRYVMASYESTADGVLHVRFKELEPPDEATRVERDDARRDARDRIAQWAAEAGFARVEFVP